MSETVFYWFIPKHNEIVQTKGVFSATGLFESRDQAIAYIEQAELPVSPDEVYLVEADTTEFEEAAVHVGADWNLPAVSDTGEVSKEDIVTVFETWGEQNTTQGAETLQTAAENQPNLLTDHLCELVEQYDGLKSVHQSDLEDVFTALSETGGDEIESQIPTIANQFREAPTADIAEALVLLAPKHSSHSATIAEAIIDVVDDETLAFAKRLAIANHLATLVSSEVATDNMIIDILDEQASPQAELLADVGLSETGQTYCDISTLVDQVLHGGSEARRAAVYGLDARLDENSDIPIADDTVADIQSILVEEWTQEQHETRNRARSVITTTARQYPATLSQITDGLVTDLEDTFTWQSSAYGVLDLPEYGRQAAISLGRYCAATESVPPDLLKVLAEADRRRRSQHLISYVASEYPPFLDELVEYAGAHPDTLRLVYNSFGLVASGEGSASTKALNLLVDGVTAEDRSVQEACYTGLRKATLGNADQDEESKKLLTPSVFFERLPRRRLSLHQTEVAEILTNVADGNPAVVSTLWDYVERPEKSDSDQHSVQQIIAANALAGVARDSPEVFADIDRCTKHLGDWESPVTESFIAIIESVWGDQPDVVKSLLPELRRVVTPQASRSLLNSVLNMLLPLAMEYPDQIETETVLTLTSHDADHVRKQVYDIIGYAGSPESYSVLTDAAESEDSDDILHTLAHARTRIEARFPDANFEDT